MKILLTGVSCVGKTTVGAKLATLLGIAFFDLDKEVEAFFGAPIERLQRRFRTMDSFREQASKALEDLLRRPEAASCVIALPPSGLMGPYWHVVEKSAGTVIALNDTPSNILQRIRFYDTDSLPIEKQLTEREKAYYLSELRKDIAYFGRSYRRAHAHVNIAGLSADLAAAKVKAVALAVAAQTPSDESRQPGRPL